MTARDGSSPLIAFAVLRIVAAATGGNCDECIDYLTRRRRVLVEAINETAADRKLTPADLLVAYMNGIHNRHHYGLSLTEATA